MSDFESLLASRTLQDGGKGVRGYVKVIDSSDLLDAHKAAIAQAVKEEREQWLKICLSMTVGSLDERINEIEKSQIVTPELINKVVHDILKKVVHDILEADHEQLCK